MILESDNYSESDILNVESYDKILGINKLIENDFFILMDSFGLLKTEKERLKCLFYKYGVVSYKLKECE